MDEINFTKIYASPKLYCMRIITQRVAICFALLLLPPACFDQSKKAGQNTEAETAGPHLANLCIVSADWPRLLAKIKAFGMQHDLSLHGGISNDTPDGRPMLNVYLAQGYSYYFGDDFDLWFVSDPFRKHVVTLNGILKIKPITAQQSALSEALLSDIRDVSTLASGTEHNPSCTRA